MNKIAWTRRGENVLKTVFLKGAAIAFSKTFAASSLANSDWCLSLFMAAAAVVGRARLAF